MPISFTCPHCGTQSEVADQYAGQSGPCKSCGNTITIPHAAAADIGGAVRAPRTSSSTPVIVVIAFYVVQWDAGTLVKLPVVVLSSFAVTLGLYELFIRRIGAAQALFGMKAR